MNIAFLLLVFCFQYSRCADSCGKYLQKLLQTRIIAGSNVGYYKYPWFGALNFNKNLKCGCTMIADRFALTAANCFKSQLPLNTNQDQLPFSVTLGIYNRCDKSEATIKTFRVDTVYIHDRYLQGKTYNDIALLKLTEPTGFEPACLPSKPIKAKDRPSEGVIIGLGMIGYNPVTKTCMAHEGRVLVYDDHDCAEALESLGEDNSLLDTGFCAGGAQETKPYGCGVDLGGPLIAKDDTGSWYIFGIISFRQCSDNENVTLYKDVSKYLDWIHTVIDPTQPDASIENPEDPADLYYDYDTDSSSTGSSSEPSVIFGVKSNRRGDRKYQKKHINLKNQKHKKKKNTMKTIETCKI